MKKRYFLIPAIIIVVGLFIWACKYSLGPGLDFELLNKATAVADGKVGYDGEITYNKSKAGVVTKGKRITPNMDSPVEVFPFQDGTAYYRIPSLVVTTKGTLLAFEIGRAHV